MRHLAIDRRPQWRASYRTWLDRIPVHDIGHIVLIRKDLVFYEGGCQEKKILLRAGPGAIGLASSPTLAGWLIRCGYGHDCHVWFPIPAFPRIRMLFRTVRSRQGRAGGRGDANP